MNKELIDDISRISKKNSSDFPNISTDTRSLKEGEIFLALRGENFDGHSFIEQALEKEAVAVIVDNTYVKDKKVKEYKSNFIVVEDTIEAYQEIASWWRNKFTIPVIAVTGSAGKTTTKELIAAVLSKSGKVLKTQENLNNDIGVAKTLLELNKSHSFAVIEMGMRGKGEISRLSRVVQPTIAVITNSGRAHIERLGSEENIARAKCEIVDGLSEKGVFIFDNDNEMLRHIASEMWKGVTITFGVQSGDVNGLFLPEENAIQVDRTTYHLPLSGKHNAVNFLATIAVVDALNIDRSNLAHFSVDLPSGRGDRSELPNNIVLFNETYNASPEAMISSLELLKHFPGKRKIAVLGEMRELGDFSKKLHKNVGEKVSDLGIDLVLVLVDSESGEELFKAVKEEVTEKHFFTTKEKLVEFLVKNSVPGDRLLFKAAHSVGLETVLEQVKKALS